MREILLLSVQMNSEGETSVRESILQLRLLGMGVILALVGLTGKFLQEKRGWIAAFVTVVVFVLWAFDCHYTDQLARYADRSHRILRQISTLGPDSTFTEYSIPEWRKSSRCQQLAAGLDYRRRAEELVWYITMLGFALIIIRYREDFTVQVPHK